MAHTTREALALLLDRLDGGAVAPDVLAICREALAADTGPVAEWRGGRFRPPENDHRGSAHERVWSALAGDL